MNFIAIVIYACLLLVPEISTKKQSDRELAGLSKFVRVVREYRTSSGIEPKPAEISKLLAEQPYKIVTYNKKGVLLEENNLYGRRYTYNYDADGFRLKTVNGDTMPGSGNPIGAYVAERDANKYDSLGRKIETVTHLNDDPVRPWIRQTYEYDNKGRVLKVSHYWRDSNLVLSLHRVVTYTYNVKGVEEEVNWHDATGALMDKFSYSNYKYDSKGNWIERAEARFQVYDKNQPEKQYRTVYRIITYF